MSAPTSNDRQVLLDVIALLEADADMIDAFGFSGTKRILRADDGNVAPEETPKLILTNWHTIEEDATFGARRGTIEEDAYIAAVLYCRVDPTDPDFEPQKDLVTDLAGLVRDKIRALKYADGQLWYDVTFHKPTTQFDTAENFQRAVTVFIVSTRRDATPP